MTNVTGEKLFTEIIAGHNFSCARSSEGDSYCWGNNGSGKQGLNLWDTQEIPAKVYTNDLVGATKFRKYQPQGTSNSCGITGDGKLYCAGLAMYGANGDDDISADKIKPTPVHLDLVDEDDKTWIELSGGRGHETSNNHGSHSTCAILTGGAMYCWGQNARNQIGPMSGTGVYLIPTPFNGL